MTSPRVDLPQEAASVVRDPEEIALIMGETISDGIMNNTMSKITDKDRVGNLTKTIGSSQGSAGDPFGATGDLLAAFNRSTTKTAA